MSEDPKTTITNGYQLRTPEVMVSELRALSDHLRDMGITTGPQNRDEGDGG